jgi:hypothetical protein
MPLRGRRLLPFRRGRCAAFVVGLHHGWRGRRVCHGDRVGRRNHGHVHGHGHGHTHPNGHGHGHVRRVRGVVHGHGAAVRVGRVHARWPVVWARGTTHGPMRRGGHSVRESEGHGRWRHRHHARWNHHVRRWRLVPRRRATGSRSRGRRRGTAAATATTSTSSTSSCTATPSAAALPALRSPGSMGRRGQPRVGDDADVEGAAGGGGQHVRRDVEQADGLARGFIHQHRQGVVHRRHQRRAGGQPDKQLPSAACGEHHLRHARRRASTPAQGVRWPRRRPGAGAAGVQARLRERGRRSRLWRRVRDTGGAQLAEGAHVVRGARAGGRGVAHGAKSRAQSPSRRHAPARAAPPHRKPAGAPADSPGPSCDEIPQGAATWPSQRFPATSPGT